MLNNYLEKRAAINKGTAANVARMNIENIIAGLWRGHRWKTISTLGGSLATAGGLGWLGGSSTSGNTQNLATGNTQKPVATPNNVSNPNTEKSKGIIDHISNNIGTYALAGTGLLGLGALGSYLASKPDDEEDEQFN